MTFPLPSNSILSEQQRPSALDSRTGSGLYSQSMPTMTGDDEALQSALLGTVPTRKTTWARALGACAIAVAVLLLIVVVLI